MGTTTPVEGLMQAPAEQGAPGDFGLDVGLDADLETALETAREGRPDIEAGPPVFEAGPRVVEASPPSMVTRASDAAPDPRRSGSPQAGPATVGSPMDNTVRLVALPFRFTVAVLDLPWQMARSFFGGGDGRNR